MSCAPAVGETAAQEQLATARLEIERLRRDLERARVRAELWREAFAADAARQPRWASTRLAAALRALGGNREPPALSVQAVAERVESRERQPAGPTSGSGVGTRWLSHPPVPGQERVRAAVASIPSRDEGLRVVVDRLYPQVDEICVYLNGYDDVPEFLTGDDRLHVFTGTDLGDRGKFRFVDDFRGYYLTLDDDIDYPPFYVDHLLDGIERFERRAVVGWHGSVLHEGITDYYARGVRDILDFGRNCPKDRLVHVLGTGCAGFHTDTLDVHFADFPAPNLADLFFALLAQRLAVPFVVLAHQGGWARQLDLGREHSIYAESRAASASSTNVRAEAAGLLAQPPAWRQHVAPRPYERPPLAVEVLTARGTAPCAERADATCDSDGFLLLDMLSPWRADVRWTPLESAAEGERNSFAPGVVVVELPPHPAGASRTAGRLSAEESVCRHAEAGRAVLLALGAPQAERKAWRQELEDVLSGVDPGARHRVTLLHDLLDAEPGIGELTFTARPDDTAPSPGPRRVAQFHASKGVYLGDVGDLAVAAGAGVPVVDRLEAVRASLPDVPLLASRRTSHRSGERDLVSLVTEVLPVSAPDDLPTVRLAVPLSGAAGPGSAFGRLADTGVPVVRAWDTSAPAPSATAVAASEPELPWLLPCLYGDPSLWRAHGSSRSSDRRSSWLAAGRLYLRLLSLAASAARDDEARRPGERAPSR